MVYYENSMSPSGVVDGIGETVKRNVFMVYEYTGWENACHKIHYSIPEAQLVAMENFYLNYV